MDAKELRIGNLIYQDGKLYEVDANDFTLNFELMGFSPIPLSPEILEQCGLEKKEMPPITQYFKRGGTFYFSILYDPKGEAFLLDSPHYGKLFKYLHQLQNLYFSLTGSELEIKGLAIACTT